MQRFQAISTLVSLTASFWIFQPLLVTAQIIPDNSLGNENSVVVPNININNINSDIIEGGAIRGSNLFHSFQEFNIDNGRGAYFSNPGNISNILTRITGNNLSNILGTLGVLGNANLFLINPNGIVFGPNARLDVDGSFFASTADSILFENSVEFAASNPEAPTLLTINIPIGLKFRENPGNIVNQAVLTTTEEGNLLRDNNGFLIPQGLTVPQNQTLALVGGNVLFDNGVAISPGSNIELGGLSKPGIVELNADGSLTFPGNIQQANIALTNNSQINIRADNSGDININAGNFEISGGSVIRAGIDAGLGFSNAQGGDININAQDSVIFTDPGSSIRNNIDSNAIGNPGDININTNSLLINDDAFINTITFGTGNAGNVKIQAPESVELSNNSAIVSLAEENTIGNAGNVTIETGQIQINGSQIITGNSGQGNAGSVTIQASESVQLINGGIFSGITENTMGNAGNIAIETSQLQLLEGSQIIAGNLGEGDGGNITIIASESVEISGTTSSGESSSNLFANIDENAVGNAGNITIETLQLRMTDEAQIIANNSGQGDAGDVTIRASDSVQLISGDIFSNVTENTTGNAGNITIETPQLRMIDGAQIITSTEGEGNGGTIIVKAENIDVSGTILSPEGRNISSGFLAQSGTSGNAGTVIIEAQQLRLTDGAVVDVAADNAGDAGTIIVRADDVELLDGLGSQNNSILDASVKPVRTEGSGSGTGSGGSVTVEAERLVLRNGGVDVGLNNLAAVTSNQKGFKPFLINGRPVKAVNNFYNKKKAELQSQLKGNRKTSNKIQRLSSKRGFKIDDYLHKSSRFIINQLVESNISTLVIGKNENSKQEINIGKVNNQNFTSVPHARLIEMLTYKAQLVGIKVVITEESYTSIASFLDADPLPIYGTAEAKTAKFSGRRLKRGLYYSKIGVKFNADVNGSYNIIRKVVPDAFCNGIEGVVVHPVKITLTN